MLRHLSYNAATRTVRNTPKCGRTRVLYSCNMISRLRNSIPLPIKYAFLTTLSTWVPTFSDLCTYCLRIEWLYCLRIEWLTMSKAVGRSRMLRRNNIPLSQYYLMSVVSLMRINLVLARIGGKEGRWKMRWQFEIMKG